ncbi:MAG: 16S rRNA (guanine(527)-N(7))-methyltransferase RsmG [Puniceicoccales bacterium]|jgi:16S rRNA (guanine527-N7)-methyltransferase|nr:16S rRNA (guanine(527)-N(7))-methyltransferase RsmG [Puniceicoccales bacterium]
MENPWNAFFGELSEKQRKQLEYYHELLKRKNGSINLLSRKQSEQILTHHIFPCLAIGSVLPFSDGSRIMDVGTGGGLPGIPLAIRFPNCQFLLIDSIGKKICAVEEFIDAIGLCNVSTFHGRVEQLPYGQRFNVAMGRAVAAIPKFFHWSWKYIEQTHGADTNNCNDGLIYLNGGEPPSDWNSLGLPTPRIIPLEDFFLRRYAIGKWIAHFRR